MRGIVATDLLTLEELEIADRRLSREVEARDVLLGRPLDDGSGTLRLQSAPVAIPRLQRSRLLGLLREGGSARQLAAALAPTRPTVRTTGGEELVFCTARYDVGALEETWRRLAERLDADPEEETLRRLSANDTILGTVRREGGRLVLETNAVERLRSLQEILLEVDSQARLVDESTVPMDLGSLGDPSASDSLTVPATEPELTTEDVADIQRMLEDRWLDEGIPVLGGETPREAAGSSRRDDLVALLDDYEWEQRRTSSPIAMDLARLRRELGIDG
jgi:hypothetical protein